MEEKQYYNNESDETLIPTNTTHELNDCITCLKCVFCVPCMFACWGFIVDFNNETGFGNFIGNFVGCICCPCNFCYYFCCSNCYGYNFNEKKDFVRQEDDETNDI
jgi:hypothetical protein